jgi:hypothetical protein
MVTAIIARNSPKRRLRQLQRGSRRLVSIRRFNPRVCDGLLTLAWRGETAASPQARARCIQSVLLQTVNNECSYRQAIRALFRLAIIGATSDRMSVCGRTQTGNQGAFRQTLWTARGKRWRTDSALSGCLNSVDILPSHGSLRQDFCRQVRIKDGNPNP